MTANKDSIQRDAECLPVPGSLRELGTLSGVRGKWGVWGDLGGHPIDLGVQMPPWKDPVSRFVAAKQLSFQSFLRSLLSAQRKLPRTACK